MTVVVDVNILIAFALADEPLHLQAGQLLAAWQNKRTFDSATSISIRNYRCYP